MVQHGATVFTAVPTMYIGLIQAAARSTARPPLRYAVSGGAALPVAVLEAFARDFGAEVHEGYGLTETSPAVAFNHVGEPIRPGTVGRPAVGRRHRDRRRRRRRPHRAAARRRAGRDRRARPRPVQGLPGQPGGVGRGGGRRLVPHRRPGHQGRRRHRHDRRPQEGHDRPQRLQRVPERGRGRDDAAPRGRVRGGVRAAPTRRAARRCTPPSCCSTGTRRRPTSWWRSCASASPPTSSRAWCTWSTPCRSGGSGKVLKRELVAQYSPAHVARPDERPEARSPRGGPGLSSVRAVRRSGCRRPRAPRPSPVYGSTSAVAGVGREDLAVHVVLDALVDRR